MGALLATTGGTDARSSARESAAQTAFGWLVLVGLPGPFAETLVAQADAPALSIHSASKLEASLRPKLIIVNLDLEDGIEQICSLRSACVDADIVAITSAPCVIRIAQAVKQGASLVMARPTTLAQICAAVGHPNTRPAKPSPMSLDRAIWEFLNQAVIEAGSISGAARLLRLDRTSLKRMLRKIPGA